MGPFEVLFGVVGVASAIIGVISFYFSIKSGKSTYSKIKSISKKVQHNKPPKNFLLGKDNKIENEMLSFAKGIILTYQDDAVIRKEEELAKRLMGDNDAFSNISSYKEDGQFVLAEQALHLALDTMKGNDQGIACINYLLAEVAEEQSDIHKALDYISESIKLYPDNPNYLFNQGLLHIKAHEFKKAKQAFEICLKIQPKNPEALANLGVAYQNLGFSDLAIKTFEQALIFSPEIGRACIYNNLAGLYGDTGKPEKAEEKYLASLAIEPDNPYFNRNLGLFYFKLDNIRSKQYLEKSIEYFSNDGEDYVVLGSINIEMNNFNEAESNFSHAIIINPHCQIAHHCLGGMYFHLKKHTAAISSLKNALRISPEWETYNNLGAVYFDAGDIKQAKASYLKATEQNPEKGPPHYYLGLLYAFTGEPENAIKHMKWAIAINEGDALIHQALAEQLEKTKEYEQAITYYKEVIQQSSENAHCLLSLANCYYEIKEFESCEMIYRECVKLHPDYVRGNFRLGTFLSQQYKSDEGYEYIQKAVNQEPKNQEYQDALRTAGMLLANKR